MAILTAPDRAQVWARWMADLSERRDLIGITKPELRAAVDGIDKWIEDNALSFNLAIPEPARSSLTASQKVRLLFVVLRRRMERGD